MTIKPPPRRMPPAPDKYDRQDQQEVRNRIERMDDEALKVGRDIELANNERIILRDAAGARYALTITAGVLGLTAL